MNPRNIKAAARILSADLGVEWSLITNEKD
jgi:hypothetical protein